MKRIAILLLLLFFTFTIIADERGSSFTIEANKPFIRNQSFKIIDKLENSGEVVNNGTTIRIDNFTDIPLKIKNNDNFKPLFDIVYTSNYLINTEVDLILTAFSGDDGKILPVNYQYILEYDESNLNGYNGFADNNKESSSKNKSTAKEDKPVNWSFELIRNMAESENIISEDNSKSGIIACTISIGIRWDSEKKDELSDLESYQQVAEEYGVENGDSFSNDITIIVTQG